MKLILESETNDMPKQMPLWKRYIKVEKVGGQFTLISRDNRIKFGTFDTIQEARYIASRRYKDTQIWKDEQFEKIVLAQQEDVVES